MVSILNPDLYARFSTSEGMRMKLLSKEETSIVKAFLKVPIPEYVLAYADGQIDLLDCYEVAFNFANELLRGRKNKSKCITVGLMAEALYLSPIMLCCC